MNLCFEFVNDWTMQKSFDLAHARMREGGPLSALLPHRVSRCPCRDSPSLAAADGDGDGGLFWAFAGKLNTHVSFNSDDRPCPFTARPRSDEWRRTQCSAPDLFISKHRCKLSQI
jgi:hypothetical protein